MLWQRMLNAAAGVGGEVIGNWTMDPATTAQIQNYLNPLMSDSWPDGKRVTVYTEGAAGSYNWVVLTDKDGTTTTRRFDCGGVYNALTAGYDRNTGNIAVVGYDPANTTGFLAQLSATDLSFVSYKELSSPTYNALLGAPIWCSDDSKYLCPSNAGSAFYAYNSAWDDLEGYYTVTTHYSSNIHGTIAIDHVNGDEGIVVLFGNNNSKTTTQPSYIGKFSGLSYSGNVNSDYSWYYAGSVGGWFLWGAVHDTGNTAICLWAQYTSGGALTNPLKYAVSTLDLSTGSKGTFYRIDGLTDLAKPAGASYAGIRINRTSGKIYLNIPDGAVDGSDYDHRANILELTRSGTTLSLSRSAAREWTYVGTTTPTYQYNTGFMDIDDKGGVSIRMGICRKSDDSSYTMAALTSVNLDNSGTKSVSEGTSLTHSIKASNAYLTSISDPWTFSSDSTRSLSWQTVTQNAFTNATQPTHAALSTTTLELT